MAGNKTYSVMKDGEVLKELKTLAAAKKLADTEDAEVFCDGDCVYAPDPVTEDLSAEQNGTAEEQSESHKDVGEAEEKEEATGNKADTSGTYRLKHRMNVRTAPSKDAEKVGTKAVGKLVEVLAIENDWMHLTDHTFILFGSGKYAEKI